MTMLGTLAGQKGESQMTTTTEVPSTRTVWEELLHVQPSSELTGTLSVWGSLDPTERSPQWNRKNTQRNSGSLMTQPPLPYPIWSDNNDATFRQSWDMWPQWQLLDGGSTAARCLNGFHNNRKRWCTWKGIRPGCAQGAMKLTSPAHSPWQTLGC